MVTVNKNYLKLPGSYLFSTIAKKVAAYQEANPDVQMIWCWNQTSLLGCAAALENAQRSDIVLMGTDMSVELAKDMQGDSIKLQAITTQMPYEMGYQAVENAVKAVKGEDVEKEVMIPTYTYTKENQDEIQTYIDEHVNSLSRALNAFMTADLHITENELWFHTGAGIFYNVICLLFVLASWYPACHCVQTMVTDENFAQTWYVFWILPVIFIGVNLFMIPKYRSTLYTGRVLQCYIVLSLVLLIILLLFYVMFLMMAVSLNRNARLQQENHFLSLQQERYENLCMAIEEAKQARHDIRHHFVQLSSLAEQGDMEKIKKYLSATTEKISDYNLHFCENQAVDSVFGYYSTLAKKENIPFHALVSLPTDLSIDEINLCLVFSNLLENAIQASVKTEPARRKINVEVYPHHNHLLLIHVENTFDGKIQQKNNIFQSSKRSGNGIGIESVRHITDKNGGVCDFTYEDGIFSAKIMLRI